MAICVSGVCGTGTGNFPQPGDPNMNQSLLRATPAFGGIDLNWSWPTVFPEAVAFTRIWRNTVGVFSSAARIVDAAMGSFYYDRIDIKQNLATRYWYWIQMVSVNGTESEIIGPADATAKPLIEEMIEQLSGKLDRSVLGQALQERIDRIGLNSLGITAEELERAKNDRGLAVSLSEISAKADNAIAVVQQEMRLRTTADSALVQTVNTMYADFNGSVAAVQSSTTASVKAVDGRVTALASKVDTAQTATNNNIASVRQTLQTNIETVNGQVINIGARWTAVVDVNGFVGGFGVYNDGNIVAAAFNVDQFWIGKAGTARKPFIVDNNVVYIDDAAINKLTFSKLRDESGSFIVQNGKVQARFIQADQLEVQWARIQGIRVDNAHIGTAAVSTLKIEGNAVTVPVIATGSGVITGKGMGNPMVIIAANITLQQPGYVYINFGCYQGFGQGIRSYLFTVKADGAVVAQGGGQWADGFPNLGGGFYASAGLHTIQVDWEGQDQFVTIGDRSLFLMGAMR